MKLWEPSPTVRANTLLGLLGVTVRGVSLPEPGLLIIDVALRRRGLVCPRCGWRTRWRYDRRLVASTWRHLDFGAAMVTVRAQLCRLNCPGGGVVTELVPFTRVVSDAVAAVGRHPLALRSAARWHGRQR